MRKRLSVLLGVCLLILGVGAIPVFWLNHLEKMEYTFAEQTLLTREIRAQGEICPGQEYELYITQPAMTKSVGVSVGMDVQEGEQLALLGQELSYSVSNQEDLALDQSLQHLIANNMVSEKAIQTVLNQTQSSPKKKQIKAEGSALYAPIAGIITEINLKQGTAAGVTLPAITIETPNTKIVKLFVPEASIQFVKKGDPVTIKSQSFPETIYGTISAIAESAQTMGITTEKVVPVEVILDSCPTSLKNGFSVDGTIGIENPRSALLIPYESIFQDENNEEYVMIYKQGKAVRKTIKTQSELYEGVEVIEGLNGSEVLLLPEQPLKDGQRILLKGEAHGE